MTAHFWAMTTVPVMGARSECSLATVEQWTRQFYEARADGLPIADLELFPDVNRRGQTWNFLRALHAGAQSGAERITILEDDLEICRGFVARVERQPVPDDCAFLSWFDPFLGMPRLGTYGPYVIQKPREPIPGPGLARRLCNLFYCNQALTFPRRSALTILDSHLTRLWEKPHEGDQLLAQIFRGQDYGVHVPSLVQHVGEISLCNPGVGLEKNRISHHYAGRDFDAAVLGAFT